ncbi:MAG: MFS transporter [Pseudomonadota bacterium]|nr:MFS transporter [Pseudomonadota bacterium]
MSDVLDANRIARQNIIITNALSFLNNAMFVVPIIVVYYAAQKSVGLTGFLVSEAAFALAMVMMEVPSGYLSDHWKRKYTLALGFVIQTVGFVVMWLGEGFLLMVIAQAICGLGMSFVSGTGSALIYDSLLGADAQNSNVDTGDTSTSVRAKASELLSEGAQSGAGYVSSRASSRNKATSLAGTGAHVNSSKVSESGPALTQWLTNSPSRSRYKAVLLGNLFSRSTKKIGVAQYSKISGRMHAYGMVGAAVSALAGGYIYSVGVEIPTILSAFAMALAAIASLGLVEVTRLKETRKKNALKEMASVVKYALGGHKEVASILLFSSSVFVVCNLMFFLHQSYWIEGGIDTKQFGILMAIGMMVNALGSSLAYALEGRLRFVQMVAIIAALPLLSYGLAVLLPFGAGIYALFLGGLAWGMGRPLMEAAVNRRIESDRRSTVMSVGSVLHRLAFVPLTFVAGPTAEAYGVKAAMVALLVLMTLTAGASLVVMAKSGLLTTRQKTQPDERSIQKA